MAYSYTTEALYSGEHVRGMDMTPETIPCFMTTAFTMRGFKEVQETYATKGYTYVRTRNPNRTALGEVISCLEGGESTLIFSSGMGAITSTLMTLLSHGDHVICNSNIYGETYCVMTEILSKCGIEVTFVDYQNTEDIAKAVRPETKLIYSEVLSNPTLTLVDLKAVAEIAHKNGAYLMVDNTFTTPIAIRPIDFGADIVINSLTKFLNGHSVPSPPRGHCVTKSSRWPCYWVPPVTPSAPGSSIGASTPPLSGCLRPCTRRKNWRRRWLPTSTSAGLITPACLPIPRRSWRTGCSAKMATAPC